ncbi:MAG TPA: periplasmic heavy metal sensor [Pyrinomonadaceae bacterium]|nr:periplasmic heavy metal sensor [Pyrinomonadaceae bacterium]
MDGINRSKWQLRLAAAVIFLLGAAAGALAPRAYRAWFDGPRVSRQERFEQMLERLQVSAEQKAQVRQIFDDTRGRLDALRRESQPRVEEIRRQSDERLQQVLTPEQWRQFQQMVEEGRRRRRGRGGEQGKPDGR